MKRGFHVSELRLSCQKIDDFFDWFAIRANQRLGAASESEMLRQPVGPQFR
jgi:hypothetical protein